MSKLPLTTIDQQTTEQHGFDVLFRGIHNRRGGLVGWVPCLSGQVQPPDANALGSRTASGCRKYGALTHHSDRGDEDEGEDDSEGGSYYDDFRIKTNSTGLSDTSTMAYATKTA